MQIYIQIDTRTHIHACTHTHAHTHAHTDTYIDYVPWNICTNFIRNTVATVYKHKSNSTLTYNHLHKCTCIYDEQTIY